MYTLQVSYLSTSPLHLASSYKVQHSENLSYYLSIYVALSISNALLGTFRFWYIYAGSLRASRRMFDRLSSTMLRTPLRWIDTVPTGRILNRFTADITLIDTRLADHIGMGGNDLFRLIGVVVAGYVFSLDS